MDPQGLPEVSIVIPALDEESGIPALIRGLPRARCRVEVALVDGGSRDRTRAVAEHLVPEAFQRGMTLRVLGSARGRAQQMNAGAAVASGRILLFLHADTRLPDGGIDAARAALEDPGVVGGGFRHSFIERGAVLRMISAASNLRARLTGTLYGDQAMFIRCEAFRRMGGYRPLPVFEDADLSVRMRRFGRTVLLKPRVRTSARRYLQGGALRTVYRMSRMKLAYMRGRDPRDLVGDYWDAPRRGLGGKG